MLLRQLGMGLVTPPLAKSLFYWNRTIPEGQRFKPLPATNPLKSMG